MIPHSHRPGSLISRSNGKAVRAVLLALFVLVLAVASAVPASATTCPYTYLQKGQSKPAVVGLVDQGDTTWKAGNPSQGLKSGGVPLNNILPELEAYPVGTFAEVGIYVFWSQIEPTKGSFNNTAIESALQTLCGYNAQYGDSVRAKLHVIATSNLYDQNGNINNAANQAQPVFAQTLGYNPTKSGLAQPWIQIIYDGNVTEPIGAWWTPAYNTEWSKLQTYLGGLYDTNELMAETLIANCASGDQEVWLTPTDSYSLQQEAQVVPNPYSDAMQLSCLESGPEAYRSTWPNTYLVESFAWFRQPDKNPNNDWQDTVAMETSYASTSGTDFPASNGYPATKGYLKNFVMEQTALTSTLQATGLNQYLLPFQQFGEGGPAPGPGPGLHGIVFQPDVSDDVFSDDCNSLVNGIAHFHQTQFELNQNRYYDSNYSQNQMNVLKNMLVSGSPANCSAK